ncbi:MAG: pyridoxine 5'-phosphate synthase [Flavobacteriales bacterium]|nr:pyridoxine 5'-phosphate synthase [Flavobacteriales bacterium]MCB9204477.1 pyridoxine 5'-phosphate synthase [Flavobacteriales bacterium]
MSHAKLSVNINKIATLRNSRGGENPSVVEAAVKAQQFGADGITVHPRPDERHIRYQDVHDLKPVVHTEFNIEGYPNQKFMQLVLDVKPTQVTLVPDPPGVLTSNAGWNTIENQKLLQDIIGQLKEAGIRSSIFIETDAEMIRAAKETRTDRIELYTESYAVGFVSDKEAAIAPFVQAAKVANEVGLGINAGHDLSLENLKYFAENIPNLLEVSIGHALISDAIYYGMGNTVKMYKNCLR